jgi:mycothiol synthase
MARPLAGLFYCRGSGASGNSSGSRRAHGYRGRVNIDLSALPDLRARGYRGPVDHRLMADLVNRWFRAVGLEDVSTAEEFDHSYAHLENCDLDKDIVLVETHDGRLAGYTRSDWWQVEGGERKYAVFAKLDPDWRDTPLPLAILEAGVEHGVRTAGSHDVDCAKVLEGWAAEAEQVLQDAYLALGFKAVTYGAMMVRSSLEDIPELTLPEGLEIRPVEESHLRTIWEADHDAFRDHWGYTERTEEDWERFVGFPHRDETLWKIAWEGDRVVGQVKSFINEAENAELDQLRGWTEFISTHRDWRKRGVASALICESLKELKARGMTEAALGVHTENPTGAFRLYESLGYEVRESYTTYQRPID